MYVTQHTSFIRSNENHSIHTTKLIMCLSAKIIFCIKMFDYFYVNENQRLILYFKAINLYVLMLDIRLIFYKL